MTRTQFTRIYGSLVWGESRKKFKAKMPSYSPYTLQIGVKTRQLLYLICLLLIIILTTTLSIRNSQLTRRDTLIVQNVIDNRMQNEENDQIDRQNIENENNLNFDKVLADRQNIQHEGNFDKVLMDRKKFQSEDNIDKILFDRQNIQNKDTTDKKIAHKVVNKPDPQKDKKQDENDDVDNIVGLIEDNIDDDEDNGEKLQEVSFNEFKYPLEVDIRKIISQVKHRGYADYKPINLYPYKTVFSPTETCVGKKVHMIILVKSGIGNFDRRQTIRETWGSINRVEGKEIKYAFTLGILPNNQSMQVLVDEENDKYNDIIQYDFFDAYYNNTLKTTGAINWVTKFCPGAEYVMLVDDDYFVAVDTLVLYIQNVLVFEEKEYMFMGHAAGNVSPVRSKRSQYVKWYVSVQEYPYDRYPPFVNAGAMLMTMSFAKDLQIGIQFTKRFRFDDVFIGIVLYKMKANILFQKKLYAAKCELEKKCFKKVLASHGYGDPEEARTAWETHKTYRKQKSKKAPTYYYL